MKEISKVKIYKRKAINLIKNEMIILSNLHHPFIINLYYAFQDTENLYLIMDFLTGGDLRYFLRRHYKLNEESIIFIISNIILILEYLNENNIIHRDLKPDNLLFDKDGYLNLIDFGISIKSKSHQKYKKLIGSLMYIAPEIVINKTNDFSSDYFSLDDRTYNLLKSEITRITNCFVSNYKVKQTFCPSKTEENFYGFDDVLENGKIVVLNMNVAEYKNLAKIIAAYLKLDFQTDVLKQLSKKSNKNIRPSVFISDEYQEYVTSSDADFYSQSRESKCINIVSTQSYTSILNTIKDQSSTKVIIQNLVNKLCFRTDDIFTIEDLQKQIGKEEKKKVSKTYSESSKESKYDMLHKDFISSQGNISESINTSYQNDYVFDSNFFTQTLKSFQCLGFLSTGDEILKPQQLQMIPYFKEDSNNEKT